MQSTTCNNAVKIPFFIRCRISDLARTVEFRAVSVSLVESTTVCAGDDKLHPFVRAEHCRLDRQLQMTSDRKNLVFRHAGIGFCGARHSPAPGRPFLGQAPPRRLHYTRALPARLIYTGGGGSPCLTVLSALRNTLRMRWSAWIAMCRSRPGLRSRTPGTVLKISPPGVLTALHSFGTLPDDGPYPPSGTETPRQIHLTSTNWCMRNRVVLHPRQKVR
jgi:hypothetical protein